MTVLSMTFAAGVPEDVTVCLSIDELAAITALVGAMSSKARSRVFSDGEGECLEGFWEEAQSMVFCRYWDGGIEDVCKIGAELNNILLEATK